MRFERFTFGSISIDDLTCQHDVPVGKDAVKAIVQPLEQPRRTPAARASGREPGPPPNPDWPGHAQTRPRP